MDYFRWIAKNLHTKFDPREKEYIVPIFCHDYLNLCYLKHKWGKVFKNGPSKIRGRQSLKNLKGYGLLKQIPQILLGPFLNTFSQMLLITKV